VVRFTPWPLYPRGKSPRYPLDRRLGWSPEPVWTKWRIEHFWPYRDSNSDPSVVQPVASRYTDCTIPAPCAVQFRQLLVTTHTECFRFIRSLSRIDVLVIGWLVLIYGNWQHIRSGVRPKLNLQAKQAYRNVLLSRGMWGHAVASWLRNYATSQKVAGSTPNEVIGF
jgi:hypothetical protein